MPTAYETAFLAVPERDRGTKNVFYRHVALYGYSVITDAIVDAIVATGATTIHEIGAGLGYLASLLAAEGLTVVATDIAPPDDGVTWAKTFGDLTRVDTGTVKYVTVTEMSAVKATTELAASDTVLCVQHEFDGGWIDTCPAGRVILIQLDSVQQRDDTEEDTYGRRLAAAGFVLISETDNKLFWTRRADRLQVWEHPARIRATRSRDRG